MGNITELSQGSLDGLKKQVCECIENAYNKGYADGKKEPNEEHEEYIRNLINKAKQEGYDIGLEIGKQQAISEMPEVANKENEMYNKGLEDATMYILKLYGYGIVEMENEFDETTIPDIIANNSITDIIAIIKAYEEKKKAEEEIKVGDEVKDLATDNTGVVMAIGNLVMYITNNGVYTNKLGLLEKTGRHFDEVSQLLDKLKEDK